MRRYRLSPYKPLFSVIITILFLFISVFSTADESERKTHPRELTYPESTYQIPRADDYLCNLDNGLVAFIASDTTLPLFNLRLSFHGGSAHDTQGKSGLSELTLRALISGGTKTLPGRKFKEQLDFLGAEIDFSVAEFSTEIEISGLSRDYLELLNMLAELLCSPAFDESEFLREQSEMKEQYIHSLKSPYTVTSITFKQLLYGKKHPLAQYPSEKSIESLTRENVVEHCKKIYVPANAVLSVSGYTDKKELEQNIRDALKSCNGQKPQLPRISEEWDSASPGIYIKPMALNQGFVTMGHQGIAYTDPLFAEAKVMNFILGGGSFTSRIMGKVRSDEGLAYSAGSYFKLEGNYRGYFAAYTQTKNKSVPFAISLIIDELNRIRNEVPSEKETTAAIRSLTESISGEFSTIFDSVNQFSFLKMTQLPLNWYESLEKQYAKVTPEIVRQCAKKRVFPDKMIILIVGDPDEIQNGDGIHPQKLSDFGLITILPEEP